MDQLIQRACDGVVQEVLATHFTNEGELTAHYIAEQLMARGLRVTRLGQRCARRQRTSNKSIWARSHRQ